MDTALQAARYDRITKAGLAAIIRGVDPASQKIIDAIREVVPDTDEREISDPIDWRLDESERRGR